MGGVAGNTDHILTTLNQHRLDYLLIGGVNFLLRHAPVLTYDIDVWIDDTADNRRRGEAALVELKAEWGMSDKDWGPVAAKRQGWLDNRTVCCLTSPYGTVDVFRSVLGLESWSICRGGALASETAAGTVFLAAFGRRHAALPVGPARCSTQRSEGPVSRRRATQGPR